MQVSETSRDHTFRPRLLRQGFLGERHKRARFRIQLDSFGNTFGHCLHRGLLIGYGSPRMRFGYRD
jgi:hypothetical protein